MVDAVCPRFAQAPQGRADALTLTVYEDWTVFVLAILYTLLHHGVLGTLAPGDPERPARAQLNAI